MLNPNLDERVPTLPEVLDSRAEADPDRIWVQDVEEPPRPTATRWLRCACGRAPCKGWGRGATSGVDDASEQRCIDFGVARVCAAAGPRGAGTPAYRGCMLEYAVNAVGSATLVVDYAYLERVEECAPKFASLRHVVVAGAAGRDLPKLPFDRVVSVESCWPTPHPASDVEAPKPWDLAAIIYTSGTTGPSKGVMVPWAQLAAFSIRTFPFDDLTSPTASTVQPVVAHWREVVAVPDRHPQTPGWSCVPTSRSTGSCPTSASSAAPRRRSPA